MKKVVFLFYLLFFLTPLVARGEILITEIAWMGTTNSANDEWIELYNNGNETVDLSLWSIEADDGSPNILLEGSINTKSFFILERSDDDVLPAIQAGIIYAGALSNTGEKLYLKKSGTIIQTVDASAGWPAGDNTTKDTMQWNGTLWVTAPSAPNAGSFGTNTEENNNENQENENTTPAPNDGNKEENKGIVKPVEILSVHYAPAPLVYVDKAIPVYVSAGRDRLVTTNALVVFDALSETSDGEYIQAQDYEWTFGDGAWARGKTVSHRYTRSGTYVVVLNATYPNGSAVDRATVTVFEPALQITNISDTKGLFVEITNESDTDVNLYEWSLSDSNRGNFSFPKDTIIEGGKSVKFPNEILGLQLDGMVILNDPVKNKVVVFDSRLPLTQNTEIVEIQATPPLALAKTHKVSEQKVVKIEKSTITQTKNEDGHATGTIIFEGKKNSNFLGNLVGLPRRALGFIKDLIF